MSFLSGAVGGQNNFHSNVATGDAQFREQNLQPAINTAQADYSKQLGMANDVYANQGNLAQQLLAQTQGQGPSLANQQLALATNRNNQQAAGQIASTRGLNPALAARLIAQNQASNNQTAAGQSGLLRSQEQLNAQNALANVYGQQANNALSGGQLSNSNLGINQNAAATQNAQIIQARNNSDTLNQKTAQANAEAAQSAGGGFLNGLGGVLSSPITQAALAGLTGGTSLALAPAMAGTGNKAAKSGSYNDSSPMLNMGGAAHGAEVPAFLKGGKVKAMVSPGERILDPHEAAEVREQGKNPHEMGHKVPGKAKKDGDHPENDTVPAELHPGAVVVPRSVENSEDPEKKGKEFIKALREHKEPGPKGFSKVLELKRKIDEMHGHMKDIHAIMKKVK